MTKRADGREENMRDLGRGDYFGEQVILSTSYFIFDYKDKITVYDMMRYFVTLLFHL